MGNLNPKEAPTRKEVLKATDTRRVATYALQQILIVSNLEREGGRETSCTWESFLFLFFIFKKRIQLFIKRMKRD